MLSGSNLQGEVLKQPSVLTVHFNEQMLFRGGYSVFHGGVQAEQDHTRVLCRTMQVFLDREVNLKQVRPLDANQTPAKDPAADGQPAKIVKVICDSSPLPQPVTVIEAVREGGKLVRYQRIEAPQVLFDNRDQVLSATSPGVVRMLQVGDKDAPPGQAAPGKPPAGPADKEMKLTRIEYDGKMFADNKKRSATFIGNVRVAHAPSDNPDARLDPDRPTRGAMFLTCGKLHVYTQNLAGGKQNRMMDATVKAEAQSAEFSGQADTIKYDESKQVMVFEGSPSNPAVLYEYKGRGRESNALRGVKISYDRTTNQPRVDQGLGVTITPQ